MITVLKNFLKRKSYFCFLLGAFIVSLFINTHYIEFGLPHSFHADEPEIAELAIKYTYDFRRVISEKTFYEFKPVSFVYGTVPAYFFTAFTMLYSKTLNFIGSEFTKMDLYVFMRTINAILASTLFFIMLLTFQKLFSHEVKKREITVLLAFFMIFNWKFILHAHYLNVDVIVTFLTSLANLIFISYLVSDKSNKFVILSSLFFGLAVGTKITTLLTLPVFVLILLLRRDYKQLLFFLSIIVIVFAVSNPFSVVYANDFVFRVLQMRVKENGMVFDSVDFGYFKYLYGVLHIIGLPLFLMSLLGIYSFYRRYKSLGTTLVHAHVFLLLTVVFYLGFFTLGSRRVDRWLLPIVPIFLVYATYGLYFLQKCLPRIVYISFVFLVLCFYIVKPFVLLGQFDINTPKSEAYLWMQTNTPATAKKLVITEEGLDPMNKLPLSKVVTYNVYESLSAELSMPPNPLEYEYVVLASRPMENFKRKEVANAFPFYTQQWEQFEATVLDPTKFTLEKEYTLPKPNLIEVSDIYIYKAVDYSK